MRYNYKADAPVRVSRSNCILKFYSPVSAEVGRRSRRPARGFPEISGKVFRKFPESRARRAAHGIDAPTRPSGMLTRGGGAHPRRSEREPRDPASEQISPTAGVRLLPAAPCITAQVHKAGDFASSTAVAPVSASDMFGCAVPVRDLRQHATVGAWSSIFPRRALERIARVHFSNARGSSNGPHCTARRADMTQQAQYVRPLPRHGTPAPFQRRARPPEAPGRRRSAFRSAKSPWRGGPTVCF